MTYPSGSQAGRYLRIPWWREDALSDINSIASEIMHNDWHLQRCISGDAGEPDLTVVRDAERATIEDHPKFKPLSDSEVGYNARVDSDGVHNRFCMWRFSEIPERPGMRDFVSQVRDLFPMTHDTVDLAEAYHNSYIMDFEGYLFPHFDLAEPPIKLLIPLSTDIAPLEFYNSEQELLGTMSYQGPTLVNVGEIHGVTTSKSRRQFFQYTGFYDDFQTICEALEALNEN